MSNRAPRHVVLPGGSGYLGSALTSALLARGDRVTVLSRHHDRPAAPGQPAVRRWDGRTLGAWTEAVADADPVVHLTGLRVDRRPTRANIDALIRSRVDPVRAVGAAVAQRDDRLPVWVQLSTAAIHGDAGETLIDDDTPVSGVGPPQMVQVALAWEQAAAEATAEGVQRTVVVRPGIAIGGAADPASLQLLRLARLGAGGPVDGGRQWVSWIALEDLVGGLRYVLDRGDVAGERLLTSPEPVRNNRMMAAYRAAAGRRLGLPTPAWATRIGATLLGSDPALALTGRRCVPSRLLAEGFSFHTPRIEDAVAAAVTATAAGSSRP